MNRLVCVILRNYFVEDGYLPLSYYVSYHSILFRNLNLANELDFLVSYEARVIFCIYLDLLVSSEASVIFCKYLEFLVS